jgi:hypothetical protein
MDSIEIKGTERFQKIFVSPSGEDIHISAMVAGGGCYMSLTPDEATRMIGALAQSIKAVRQDAMAYEAKETARLDAMFDDRYSEE